jgi:carbon monoxide dehydrogenase subunit G
MKLSTEIPVGVAAAEVQRCTHDLAWVLGCVPGVAIEGTDADGSCRASITVDSGEFSITMRGVASLHVPGAGDSPRGGEGEGGEGEGAGDVVVVRAHGRDRMGTLKAVAEVRVRVGPDPGARPGPGGRPGSSIGLEADLDFSGVLAPAVRLHGKSTIRKLMNRTATGVATRLAR